MSKTVLPGDVGYITINSGRPDERQIDLYEHMSAKTPDGRVVRVMKLVGDSGCWYMLSAEGGMDGSMPQIIGLSEENLKDLVMLAGVYCEMSGIDLGTVFGRPGVKVEYNTSDESVMADMMAKYGFAK